MFLLAEMRTVRRLLLLDDLAAIGDPPRYQLHLWLKVRVTQILLRLVEIRVAPRLQPLVELIRHRQHLRFENLASRTNFLLAEIEI